MQNVVLILRLAVIIKTVIPRANIATYNYANLAAVTSESDCENLQVQNVFDKNNVQDTEVFTETIFTINSDSMQFKNH